MGAHAHTRLAAAVSALLAVGLASPVMAAGKQEPQASVQSFTAMFGETNTERRPKSSFLNSLSNDSEAAEAPARKVRTGKAAKAKVETAQQAPGERTAADNSRRPRSSLFSRITGEEETARIEPAAAKIKEKSAALDADAEADANGDVPEELTPTVADPLEPLNRGIFAFNEALDFAVFRPVSYVYRTTVHKSLRVGISNALHNFSTPVILVNDFLQGRPDRAGKTFMRFLINSTAGFGGLADAAAAGGLERHSEDFGQTLGVWGAGPGIYLMIPVLGPSTIRDATGRVVDIAMHPATYLMWNLAPQERLSPTMAYAVSGHEELMDELDAMRKTSPDFYASVRDLYIQKRESDIANGADKLESIDGSGTLEPIE
ncbi:MAG: VacJ family lipoprotein [Parvibaculaceae bacterium]